jgi:hypothetical protein
MLCVGAGTPYISLRVELDPLALSPMELSIEDPGAGVESIAPLEAAAEPAEPQLNSRFSSQGMNHLLRH